MVIARNQGAGERQGGTLPSPTHTQGVAVADDVIEEGLARAVVSGEDHVLVTALAFNLHKRNGGTTK